MAIKFDKHVLIVRDPRDELIFRHLYMVKPLRDQNRLTGAALAEWLELIKQKESDQSGVSLSFLIAELDRIFSVNFSESFRNYLDSFTKFFSTKPDELFAIRYEDLVDGNVAHLEEYRGFH